VNGESRKWSNIIVQAYQDAWVEVCDRYKQIANQYPWVFPMVIVVERIIESKYSRLLHPTMSLRNLTITKQPIVVFDDTKQPNIAIHILSSTSPWLLTFFSADDGIAEEIELAPNQNLVFDAFCAFADRLLQLAGSSGFAVGKNIGATS